MERTVLDILHCRTSSLGMNRTTSAFVKSTIQLVANDPQEAASLRALNPPVYDPRSANPTSEQLPHIARL
jgi:hypothetical protein